MHWLPATGTTATEMLLTLSRQTSECGMLPEQVWSSADIPKHQLFNGHPAGSGMPLAWAHAEYIKLLRSMEDGKVWDMPPQTVERYITHSNPSPFEIWTENAPRQWVSPGKQLRMDLDEAGTIRWIADAGTETTIPTAAPILEMHSALLALPDDWKHIRVAIEQNGKTRHARLFPR